MDRAWHFLGSSTLQSLGKLTLREDAWRLPTGAERRYPVLQVGLTVGVVPFVDREHVLLIRQFRHLARETSWELPGGGGQPGESPEAAAQSPSGTRWPWPWTIASPSRCPRSPSWPPR